MLALLPYAGILSGLLLAAILGGQAALRLTLSRCATRAATSIFVSLLAAGILVATCTAVWYTDSRTVLLLAIVPIAVSIFTLMRSDDNDATPSRTGIPWRGILLTCALGVVLFLPRAANLAPLGPGPLPLRIPHPDEVFLARVGACAAMTGQETLYACGSEYHPDFRGVVPYHYFEIWLAVGFARLTGLPVVVSYTLLTVPYLACTAIVGLWAIADAAGASGWRLRAALAFAPFLPGPAWLLPESGVLSRGAESFASPPLEMAGKSLVLYSFGALAFLLVLRRKPLLASMTLCLLAPLSIVGAPAAAGGILLTAVLLRNERRAMIVVLATAVAMAVGLALFYLLLGNHAVSFGSPLRILADNVYIGSLRTRLNVAGKSILQIAVLYAPHLLTVAVVLARRRALEFLVAGGLAGALIMGGVLGYAAFSTELLSFEFATIVAAPAIYLLLTVVLAKESASLGGRVAATALLILGAVGFARGLTHTQPWSASTEAGSVPYVAQYRAAYLTAMAAARPLSRLGGFVVGPGDIGVPWDESKAIPAPALNTYTLGAPLVFLDQFAGPTFLGEEAALRGLPKQITPFLRYRRQLEPRGYTLDRTLDQYLDEVRLGYVIASRGATIPTPIARRCAESFVDPATGERFLLLALPVGKTLATVETTPRH